MDIEITLSNNAGLNSGYLYLANKMLKKFSKLVESEPPLGDKQIKITLSPDDTPRVDTTKLPIEYSVQLAVHGNFPAQFVYQCAHEFCHIYVDPRVTNRFIESFCMMSSYYFLDYLCDECGKGGQYKYFADKFHNYVSGDLSGIDRKKPVYSDVKQVKETGGNLGSADERNLQKMVAELLLPKVKNQRAAWKILSLIGANSLPRPRGDSDFHAVTNVNFCALKNSIKDHHVLAAYADILSLIK